MYMELKSILILLPVLIVPWIVLYFVFIASNKKVISNFKKLSEKYQLICDFSKKAGMKPHPNAEGIYRNRKIKINSTIRDSVDFKKVIPHTVLTVECDNENNFSFRLVKRNKRNSKLFSNNTVLADDNEFDEKFIIQSNMPGKVKKLIDFNTKFKLDHVNSLGFNGIIFLEGSSLVYLEPELLASDNALMRLELVMHELCDIAEVMKYN